MKLFFIFLTLTICISCKKERVNFPTSLYHTKTTASTNVRLFINKLEIFDKPTIDNFIKDINIFNRQNQTVGPAEKLTFISKDTVVFGTSIQKYNVSLNGNQFLFTSPPYSVSLPFTVPSGMDLYPDKITQLSSGNPSYQVNKIVVATGNYMSLEISFFSYLLSRKDISSGSSQYFYSTAGNVFNQNFINTLGQTDTLAIQEFKGAFVAK